MKVLRHETLNGWTPISIPDVPVKSKLCPACDTPLYPLVVISNKVRLGCCDRCGYMGYIDRPSKQWFEEFYKARWDQKGQGEFNPVPITRPSSPMDLQLMRLSGKKDKPLLDIGCGFGYTLSFAKHLGYKEVYGIEKSGHRAEDAAKYGFQIFNSGFEEWDPGGKKFATILHHHVLEHVEDPNAFIAKCASLQEPGDMMLLSMPNNLGEPTVGVLLYLPHVHSFSVMAVKKLLGKHNYEAVDFINTDDKTLNVMALKRAAPVVEIGMGGFLGIGAEKIIKGLDLKNRWYPVRRRLTWSLHRDDAKQSPLWRTPRGFKSPRSLIVKNDRRIKFPLAINSPWMFVK